MPYRLSRIPVDERRAELDAIVQRGSVTFIADNAPALAYRLREALNAAAGLGISPYNQLDVKISLRPPHVHVTPRRKILTVTIDVEHGSGVQESHARTEFDVVQELSTTSEIELRFPHFSGDLESVIAFAHEFGWSVVTDPFLILLRENP